MSEKRQANILKFDKNQTYDFAETSDHIFPAYHMNKNNWITIWLDGTLPNGLIFELIKKSYLLSAK
jgi:predicted DNA-binding protein (MmcQ/YjbR family)